MESMPSMHAFNISGIYAHIILFTAGLATLAYMALKVRDLKLYLFFLAVSIGTILISSNILYSFYVILSVLLVYLVFFYLKNYLQNRKADTLIVFTGFLFLLFAKIHFIFSIDHGAFYVVGHLLELVAYALILMNLTRVIRRK